jgi:hypothetical protein
VASRCHEAELPWGWFRNPKMGSLNALRMVLLLGAMSSHGQRGSRLYTTLREQGLEDNENLRMILLLSGFRTREDEQ